MVANTKFIVWTAGLSILFLITLNWTFVSAQFACIIKTCVPPQASTPKEEVPVLSPNTLAIPSLGVNTPIQEVNSNDEKVFQEALKNGVVHYPGTAQAGKPGNVYVFGHSSDYIWNKSEYKTVFARLPDIAPDAEIYISDTQGKMYTYLVFDQFVTSGDNVSILSQETNGESVLTLQTSYPIGTALKRYIVKARLQSTK